MGWGWRLDKPGENIKNINIGTCIMGKIKLAEGKKEEGELKIGTIR
jgi:hypothetical protein